MVTYCTVVPVKNIVTYSVHLAQLVIVALLVSRFLSLYSRIQFAFSPKPGVPLVFLYFSEAFRYFVAKYVTLKRVHVILYCRMFLDNTHTTHGHEPAAKGCLELDLPFH